MNLRKRGYSLMEQKGGAILWQIYKYGKDAEAVANTIVHDYGNPMPKLIGLLRLLRAGRTVSLGTFDSTELRVSGEKYRWDSLEKVPEGYVKESRGEARSIKKFFAGQLDPSQESMLNEVITMAVNEGRFYSKRDAKGAVDYAIKEYIKIKNQEMREDSRVIKKHAIKEVRRQWK